MPINIARFEHDSQLKWGVVTDNGLIPVPGEYPTTGALIEKIAVADLKKLDGTAIPFDQTKLMSPVTDNQQFVCQGANYRQHMSESGMDPDAKHYNMIFTKAQSCICAADSPVIIPEHVRFLDYEIELGLVLRKKVASGDHARWNTLYRNLRSDI